MITPQEPGNAPPPLGSPPPGAPPLRLPVAAFLVVPVPPEARPPDTLAARFFTPPYDLPPKLPDPLRRKVLPFFAAGALEPTLADEAPETFVDFGTAGPSWVIRLLKASTSGSMCCAKW
ncbi:hypothetical protein HBH98_135820 [Parastagonospora nodorum]|nr:hypothetical protein HBH46_136410 [Parastagonospora nodorum]KAH4285485.1 hypothetical protein HBI02_230340 [Parastagonospora nodorum]KAH4344710.1 hypothetical protein HBH98_135820 [Parastagonospora nodorum]KAH4427522.1 hypothetical protein HBH93_165000 [Parastagonospora nodorum]KAH4737552.1 hypothetical protein HBH64_227480 [Parastagonospora nodorum]